MGVGSSEKTPNRCLLSISIMGVLEIKPKEVLAVTHTVVSFFVPFSLSVTEILTDLNNFKPLDHGLFV